MAGEGAGQPAVAMVGHEGDKSVGRFGNQGDSFGGNCNVDFFELWDVEVDTVPTWTLQFGVADILVH